VFYFFFSKEHGKFRGPEESFPFFLEAGGKDFRFRGGLFVGLERRCFVEWILGGCFFLAAVRAR
jgi:hypothetical protein